MLAPKRFKHRKTFRGNRRGLALRGAELSFGEFGLQAMTSGWVNSRQIEAARKTLAHYTKRGGRIWIRIFPDKPVSKKPPETRMGGGKGDIEQYVAVVKPGRVVFEMGGVPKDMAQEAMRQAGAKLPVQVRFIHKS